MTFKDFFDINELFNPNMFYTGEVLLGSLDPNTDMLLMNAKSKKGKNKYYEFLQKYYYEPFSKVINSKSLAYTIPPSISLCHRADGKRHTKFSFMVYVHGKINGTINPEEHQQELEKLGLDYTEEQVNLFLKNMLRSERKKFDSVKDSGRRSPYFAEIYNLYKYYVQAGNKMGFDEFLDGMISGYVKSTFATRFYLEFFDKELNIDELVECFDYDKLCSIAARSVLDGCIFTEQNSNLVHNSAIYVMKYLEAVEEMRTKNPNYNCSIKALDIQTGKIRIYTIDDIIEEFNLLLARHPEFRRYHISQDRVYELLRMYNYDEEFIANFDIQSKDAQLVMDILQKIEDNRSLLASWDIIPKGKREETETIPVPKDPSIPLDEQEKIRRMLVAKSYLENSAYLFSLEGINEFEGYQGYLYPNGTVVFEKFYENIKTKKIASGSATYIMKLDNFVEVSKLTKSEIISKINSGEIKGVKRIFHREDMDRWKADVTRAITGSDYTVQVEEYIDELLDTKEVSKKGVKQ